MEVWQRASKEAVTLARVNPKLTVLPVHLPRFNLTVCPSPGAEGHCVAALRFCFRFIFAIKLMLALAPCVDRRGGLGAQSVQALTPSGDEYASGGEREREWREGEGAEVTHHHHDASPPLPHCLSVALLSLLRWARQRRGSCATGFPREPSPSCVRVSI